MKKLLTLVAVVCSSLLMTGATVNPLKPSGKRTLTPATEGVQKIDKQVDCYTVNSSQNGKRKASANPSLDNYWMFSYLGRTAQDNSPQQSVVQFKQVGPTEVEIYGLFAPVIDYPVRALYNEADQTLTIPNGQIIVTADLMGQDLYLFTKIIDAETYEESLVDGITFTYAPEGVSYSDGSMLSAPCWVPESSYYEFVINSQADATQGYVGSWKYSNLFSDLSYYYPNAPAFDFIEGEWQYIGESQFTDGWFQFISGVSQTWDVPTFRNYSDPNLILLLNPYGSNSPYSDFNSSVDEEGYIILNVTDPNCVLVRPNVKSGMSSESWYYKSTIGVTSHEGIEYYLEGYSFSKIKEEARTWGYNLPTMNTEFIVNIPNCKIQNIPYFMNPDAWVDANGMVIKSTRIQLPILADYDFGSNTPSFDPNSTPVYIKGEMNGWADDETWRMTEIKPNVYRFECAGNQNILAGQEFKIADANWAGINLGTYDGGGWYCGSEYYLEYGANNISLGEHWNGVMYVMLYEDKNGWLALSNDRTFIPDWNLGDPSEWGSGNQPSALKSVTVTVDKAGTFATQLLKEIEQWDEVGELTVLGTLNETDLSLLHRLSQLRTLDLSQTDISVITGCSELKNLQTVVLPSTVTEVADEAFYNCQLLSGINLPNVTKVGIAAFMGCSILKEINLPQAVEIGRSAFYNSGLTSISLPLVAEIPSYAFSNCKNLASANLPMVETFGEYVFSECSNLSRVEIPNISTLGSESFNYCSKLSELTVSEKLTEIPYRCFYSCASLSKFDFPASIKKISDYAFYNTALTEIILPEGVETIGGSAFYTPAVTVSIPASIQTISNSAFEYCTRISDVYCYSVMPPVTSAFTYASIVRATLHVPSFSVMAYILDDNWYRFAQIVAIDGNISNILISRDFTINSYEGLDEKVDLTITESGHLTVDADDALNLKNYMQKINPETGYYDDSWIWRTGVYSTLITENEMNADNVEVSLKLRTNRWHFLSFPFDVNVADIVYPEGTLWVIRKYSGEDRAALTGNTWQNMTNGMKLNAGEGYILHCANENNSYVEFIFKAADTDNKNRIFSHQDVVKPLATYESEYAHNRSWNLVGNPYPANFDIRNIDHNGVITVYDNSYYGDGNYTAYSLVDDEYILLPFEAFFVQCAEGSSDMTFEAAGRQHVTRVQTGRGIGARKDAVNPAREVYNFVLSGNEMSDRARLVINPHAAADYEIACDASKFMSDNQSIPQIYLIDNGIRYAIDERPLGEGIFTIGVRVGNAGSFTIHLNNPEVNGMKVILRDEISGDEIDLMQDDYVFTSQPGTFENRFTVYLTKADTTGIDGINDAIETEEAAYDLLGRKVSSKAQQGVYIVKQNGKTVKVIK